MVQVSPDEPVDEKNTRVRFSLPNVSQNPLYPVQLSGKPG